MGIYNYRDLEVYGEGFELAMELHRETERFPGEERYALVDQMRRSSKGVCAVIAEGFAHKRQKPEFRRYLRMAHGSVQETKVWLEFSRGLGYLGQERAEELWEAYDRLGRRLYRMLETWD